MKVLVVDDDVSLCELVAEFLRQEGYDVTEAHDGFGALTIAKDCGQSLQAVVTDVCMPGMDGFQMWRQMSALLPPDCKVLFMSGMASNIREQFAGLPYELIQKPFSFSILLDKLSS